ncbi:MAG: hypothetical protein ABIQ90_17195 [Polaromonas sp.]
MCGIAAPALRLANRDANLLMPLPIPTTKKWMLHLGLGAFHRAHQAWYFDCMAKEGDSTWALASGNIRPDMLQLLADLETQGGRYTLETITPAGAFNYHRIDAIGRVLPWSEDLHHIVAQGRKPETCIISFTVTEAGYFLDREGRLDLSHADLRMDLDDHGRRTIYGAVRAILHARRDRADHQRAGEAWRALRCKRRAACAVPAFSPAAGRGKDRIRLQRQGGRPAGNRSHSRCAGCGSGILFERGGMGCAGG